MSVADGSRAGGPSPAVTLRPVQAADLPAFFDMQRDPESVRLAAVPPRDRPAFEAHWARILADPAVAVRAVLADGALAGQVLAFPRDGQLEVGYWLDRSLWGRGIATAALRAFLLVVTARPLSARVAEHNPASVRVLQRCGFTVTDRLFAPSTPGAGDVVAEVRLTLRG